MASVAYVTSDQVLMENEQQNVDCPVSVQLPCASIQPQGTAWLVPIVNSGGILIGYNIKGMSRIGRQLMMPMMKQFSLTGVMPAVALLR